MRKTRQAMDIDDLNFDYLPNVAKASSQARRSSVFVSSIPISDQEVILASLSEGKRRKISSMTPGRREAFFKNFASRAEVLELEKEYSKKVIFDLESQLSEESGTEEDKTNIRTQLDEIIHLEVRIDDEGESLPVPESDEDNYFIPMKNLGPSFGVIQTQGGNNVSATIVPEVIADNYGKDFYDFIVREFRGFLETPSALQRPSYKLFFDDTDEKNLRCCRIADKLTPEKITYPSIPILNFAYRASLFVVIEYDSNTGVITNCSFDKEKFGFIAPGCRTPMNLDLYVNFGYGNALKYVIYASRILYDITLGDYSGVQYVKSNMLSRIRTGLNEIGYDFDISIGRMQQLSRRVSSSSQPPQQQTEESGEELGNLYD